jgi:hypothetical protein
MLRWLATQVGPTAKVKRHVRGSAEARAAAAVTTPVGFQSSGAAEKLYLVRSYDIPADDPSAARLANLSWTYDSAISAVAFTHNGDLVQAQQLLSQLSALQRTDGSIDFAFNTVNGQSIPEFRTGTMAWVGLAAVEYRASRCDTSFDKLAYGSAKWLLGQVVTDPTSPAYGLMRGGPDVTWVSTQHNLLASDFLARLADEIDGTIGQVDHTPPCPGGLAGLTSAQASAFSTRLHKAVTLMDTGIGAQLFTRLTPATASDAGTAYFREGIDDNIRPIDVQAYGALWLLGQGRTEDAQAVINEADQTMFVTGRSIALSANPLTFNNTYSAPGPFSGYLPYADTTAPNVIWTEGTLEMLYAKRALGDATSALASSVNSFIDVTGQAEGPLQANQAAVGNLINEYHVWPAAAPAAWYLLDGYTTFLSQG